MQNSFDHPRLLAWKIAELEVYLDVRASEQLISLPNGHQSFLLPGFKTQAFSHQIHESGLLESKNSLHMSFLDKGFFNTKSVDHTLFDSNSWTLLWEGEGRYIFLSHEKNLPCQISVDQDFRHGEIYSHVLIDDDKKYFPIKNLEIRLFSVWLASLGDIILHASGILVNKRGYAFLGESGAGKSTLVTSLSTHPSLTVLGEDQVILRYIDDRFYIFGTPWHTDPALCSPKGAPVEGLFFLDRSLPPGVKRIKPLDGVSRILQTAVIPYYLPDFMPLILDRLASLSEQIPFYTLSYPLGSDALRMIENL